MTLPFTHGSIQKTKKNRLTSHVWQVKMFSGSSKILKCSQPLQIFSALSGIFPLNRSEGISSSPDPDVFCPTSNIRISRQLLPVLTPSEMCSDLLLPDFLVEQCRRLFRPERSRLLLLLWLAVWHTRVDRAPQCSTVRWIVIIINAWMRKSKCKVFW